MNTTPARTPNQKLKVLQERLDWSLAHLAEEIGLRGHNASKMLWDMLKDNDPRPLTGPMEQAMKYIAIAHNIDLNA